MKNTLSSRWTSAQLIQLGKSLEGAYGTGLMTSSQKANAEKTRSDRWTTQQLLQMSAAKSLPFS
ncbi:MAG: hypothetical protein WBD47_07790 [Phormidesmis sp.]